MLLSIASSIESIALIFSPVFRGEKIPPQRKKKEGKLENPLSENVNKRIENPHSTEKKSKMSRKSIENDAPPPKVEPPRESIKKTPSL